MTLKEKYRKLLTDAKAITELAISEDRGLTDEEKAKITNMVEEAKQVKATIAMAEEISAMDAALESKEITKKSSYKGSIADALLESESYKAWLKGLEVDGRIPDSVQRIHSPSVKIGKTGLFRKDLVTGASDTSAGAFVTPDNTGVYEPLGRFPTVLRDLISVRQTTSDAVEYVRQTAQVTQAAPVPEANVTTPTGYTGEVSGTKPEGAIAFEKVTEPVKTIAVWVPSTKRALSDAAQIRGIIDQELRDDLADELENQMFTGNGVGENFTGLEHTAGTLVETYDTSILKTTRKALTSLRVTGRTRPTAWVFNPVDWESIELLQDDSKRYYGNGPFGSGPKTLWGVPVVESHHVTAGAGWLANWRKAVLWDREAASIAISDSHNDFFIRNLIAILGEMRAAFGLIRPSAFIEVELS